MVKKYLDEIESCNALIKQNTNDGEAYLKRAIANLCLSNHSEAKKDCDKAIEFCSKNELLINAYVNSGFAKTALGEYTSAREDYNKAIRLSDNSSSSAFCFRGELNRLDRQDEAAIRDFEKAIEIKKENLQAHLFLGNMKLLRSRKERAEAEIEFNKIIESTKDASDEFTYMMRAIAWVELATFKRQTPKLEGAEAGNFDRKADEEILKARKLNPDNIYIEQAEAYIRYKLKEYDKALKIIENLLQKNSKFIDAYVLRSKVYEALRAESDLQILRQLPGYQETQKEDFLRQGNLIVLRKSNHAYDADKVKILSNEKNLAHLGNLRREGGWKISHIQCYWKEYVEDVSGIAFDVFSLKENRFVGMVWLYNIDLKEREVEFGIIIDSQFARNGYSTECHLLCMKYFFNELDFKKMKFDTFRVNEAMVNFYQKVCGLTPEAETDRDFTYRLSKEQFIDVERKITQKITTKIKSTDPNQTSNRYLIWGTVGLATVGIALANKEEIKEGIKNICNMQ